MRSFRVDFRTYGEVSSRFFAPYAKPRNGSSHIVLTQKLTQSAADVHSDLPCDDQTPLQVVDAKNSRSRTFQAGPESGDGRGGTTARPHLERSRCSRCQVLVRRERQVCHGT